MASRGDYDSVLKFLVIGDSGVGKVLFLIFLYLILLFNLFTLKNMHS